MEKPKQYKPVIEQQYEYRIIDYQKPYKDYASKEKVINTFAAQGWELISTSVIPMGISDDRREIGWYCNKCGNLMIQEMGRAMIERCSKCKHDELSISIPKQIWCIEHLYLRRVVEKVKKAKKGE